VVVHAKGSGARGTFTPSAAVRPTRANCIAGGAICAIAQVGQNAGSGQEPGKPGDAPRSEWAVVSGSRSSGGAANSFSACSAVICNM
jgi:hypothetical protein